MKSCILALDQGTTSSRAIVFDENAQVMATAQSEFPQHFPEPGRVEHDAEDIWRTTLATARAAVAEAEARGGRVDAIGVTNQRETCLFWDRETLKPAGRAIVWQDRRTADACAAMKSAGVEGMIRERTGLLLDPYFSATKAQWMLAADEGLRRRAADGAVAFGTIDSFLLARLTGGAHATDATNASRTMLYDIRRNAWDDDLLRLFDVPAACLPKVMDCADAFGVADESLFGRRIPVFAMIGDQQAAAVGQACFSPGDVKSTYGTGCFVLVHTGERCVLSDNRLLTTIAARIDGRTTYALEGSIFVAGAAIQWLRDALGLIGSSAETEALARSIDSTGGVYLVPAFAGLGAPHWRADARGVITGLTRGSGRAEIVRAALEAVVYQTSDLLDAMARDGAPVTTLKVDGGMVANDWLLQFLADILDAPVERPVVLETTALGAAFLAGVKAGVYESLDAVARLRKQDRVFTPALSSSARTACLDGWRKALSQALA